MHDHLPFDSLHELLTFHQKKLHRQPQHNFRLRSSVVQLRYESVPQHNNNNHPHIEFVLIRRRLDDRGLYVAILDDSWENLTATAVQLLSLPDDYYEKIVYCHPLPFQVLRELLPLHSSRRQCVCWDESLTCPEVALACMDAPVHLILHPFIFKNNSNNSTNGDPSLRFVECLAQRFSPFGSLTVYENALSDVAWTRLLQLLSLETTTAPPVQTLELIDLDIPDAALLANAQVETLSLSHCSLADDGESLRQALTQGRRPTRLVLDQVVGWEVRLHHSRKTVPLDAWSNLMLTFAKPTCRVQHLELGSSPYYDVGGFFLAFLQGLAHNDSLESLVIRKYDGTLGFWDDLADIVIHHTTLRSIALVYESSICHDAARMFRAMARVLEINRNIIVSFDGDYHNRTFERIVVPKLRMNQFHRGTQTLRQVSSDSIRAFLFVQALMSCCTGSKDVETLRRSSRLDPLLRTWWLLSRNTDVLVSLLHHRSSTMNIKKRSDL